ncbi:unnamed protein product [Rangifer tarandus platyrhynchus]|uniref:Uncharacterized protein n=1 Tax=Rangifer tarandus platyrhynchus TaxID=3082113 RepID=A0ABN8Y4X6_RANTA|nr:unnamed protein product [Rangifer tarandus platyrhynchus]
MEPPGELANGRRGWRHNVEMLQNVNTARRAGDRVCRRAPHPGLLGPLEPHDSHVQGCLSCTLLQRARRDHSHNDASSVCLLSHFSRVQLFATPWTVACQAPLCTGFSRLQQYVNQELQVFKLDLEKGEEPEVKLPTSAGS